jgi:hypothetical protein
MVPDTGGTLSAVEAYNRALGDSCREHGQDVGQVNDDLYARALRGELTYPGDPTRRIDPQGLANITINRFYGPSWPEAAEFLSALAGQQPAASTRQTAATEPFPIASLCGDHKVRFSSEREWQSLWRKQSTAAPTPRTHFAWAILPLCSDWPGKVANPQRMHGERGDGLPRRPQAAEAGHALRGGRTVHSGYQGR